MWVGRKGKGRVLRNFLSSSKLLDWIMSLQITLLWEYFPNCCIWKISGKTESEYLIHKESFSSSFALIDPKLSQGSSVLINTNIENLLVWFSWLTPVYMGCTKFSQWLTHLHFKYQLPQCSWERLQPANLLAYRNCIGKPCCSKVNFSNQVVCLSLISIAHMGMFYLLKNTLLI